MKLLSQKVIETVAKESLKVSGENKAIEVEKFIAEMKKAGLIKQTNYNLPLVDTIGKAYYSSLNKRKEF